VITTYSRGRAQDLFSLDRLRHELSLPLAQPLTPRGPAQSNMPSEADPLTLEIRAVEVSSQRALQEKVGAAAGALAARVQSTFGLLEGDLRDLRSQLHLQREGHFAAMDASYEELLTHFGVGALEVAESYRERFEALGREHAAAHRRRKSRRSVNESGLWKTEMNNLFEATLQFDRKGRLREQRLNEEMVREMEGGGGQGGDPSSALPVSLMTASVSKLSALYIESNEIELRSEA